MRLVSLVPGRLAASRRPARAASTSPRIAFAPRPLETGQVTLLRPGRDAQDRHARDLVLVDVRVDADDASLPGIELALIAVGRIGDLALRVALGDGGHHAAAAVDLVEVAPDLALGLVGQGLDEPRPAERVHRGVHPALLGDDLLLTQGEQRRRGGRDGERLVVGVGVERLGPAEHAGECLERDPGQVVERLLRGQRHAGGLGVEAHPRAAARSRRRSASSSGRARSAGSPGTWRSPRRSPSGC